VNGQQTKGITVAALVDHKNKSSAEPAAGPAPKHQSVAEKIPEYFGYR
jgi:hypothetical protein